MSTAIATIVKQDFVLQRLDPIVRMLAECTTAPRAKGLTDLARAAEIYARRQKLGSEAINKAHAVVIDGSTLLGQLLQKTELSRGGRSTNGRKTGPLGGPVLQTLKELKLTKNDSSNAQFLAALKDSNKYLHAEIRQNLKTITKARREERIEERTRKVRAAQRNRKRRQPVGPFDVILADPPWPYNFSETDARKITNQYNIASLEDIFKHSPNSSDNAILFLWGTAPKLPEALKVMEQWGFTYKSCAVWDKEVIGMGYWWRIQHELLLVGTKGSPGTTPECERVSSIFREKRTKHSVKPTCVYEWIERAFPDRSRQEMYQRKPRPGWAGWGDEV
jgi:N6-adenosine-specific RNA methylase IME4